MCTLFRYNVRVWFDFASRITILYSNETAPKTGNVSGLNSPKLASEEPFLQNFLGGACPHTPLASAAYTAAAPGGYNCLRPVEPLFKFLQPQLISSDSRKRPDSVKLSAVTAQREQNQCRHISVRAVCARPHAARNTV